MMLLTFIASFVIIAVKVDVLHASTVIESYRSPHNLGWLFGINDLSNEIDARKNGKVVCETEECKMMADVIGGSMNRSVDPCDNFYEYACGNWGTNNPPPEGEESWSLWAMAQKAIDERTAGIMDSGPQPDDILAVRLAKKWHESCMDVDAIEKQGLQPFLSVLSRSGGWPVIMESQEWDENKNTWQKVEQYYMNLYGKVIFHRIRITHDNEDFFKKIIMLSPGDTPDGSWYLDNVDDDDESEEEEDDHSDESRDDGEEDDSKDDDVGRHKYQHGDGNSIPWNSNEIGENTNPETMQNENHHHLMSEQDAESRRNISKRKQTVKENQRVKVSPRRKSQNEHHAKKINQSIVQHERTHAKRHKSTHRNRKPRSTDKEEKEEDKDNEEKNGDEPDLEKHNDEDCICFKKVKSWNSEMEKYAQTILKVAKILAETRGSQVPEEQMMAQIRDMVKFQRALLDVMNF